jgi:hypothetical protein
LNRRQAVQGLAATRAALVAAPALIGRALAAYHFFWGVSQVVETFTGL